MIFRAIPLSCFVLLFALVEACALSGTGAKDGQMAKISPELQKLYEPGSSATVTIDASASGDVAALRADLTALGMTGASSAGRIVSGQLPVSAIASLAMLSTLKFAWLAASKTNRDPARPER